MNNSKKQRKHAENHSSNIKRSLIINLMEKPSIIGKNFTGWWKRRVNIREKKNFKLHRSSQESILIQFCPTNHNNLTKLNNNQPKMSLPLKYTNRRDPAQPPISRNSLKPSHYHWVKHLLNYFRMSICRVHFSKDN